MVKIQLYFIIDKLLIFKVIFEGIMDPDDSYQWVSMPGQVNIEKMEARKKGGLLRMFSKWKTQPKRVLFQFDLKICDIQSVTLCNKTPNQPLVS